MSMRIVFLVLAFVAFVRLWRRTRSYSARAAIPVNPGSFAVVSGATGGVGVQLVKILQANYFQVICVVRQTSDQTQLRDMGVKYFMHFDYSAPESFTSAFEAYCSDAGIASSKITAFYSLHGGGMNVPVREQDAAWSCAYIAYNVNSHVCMAQHFLRLPQLKEIACVSSLNAHLPGYQVSLYAGSKAFLERFYSGIITENPYLRAVILAPPAITNTRFLYYKELAGVSADAPIYKKPFAVGSWFVAYQLFYRESGIHRIGWVCIVLAFLNRVLGERIFVHAMKQEMKQ